MSKKPTHLSKNFEQYAEALKKNIKERRDKKKKEVEYEHSVRQLDTRTSDQKQDD